MMNYELKDSKFWGLYEDEPPLDWVYEALSQVEKELSSGDTWICKGNYQLNFWLDMEDKNTIYCNAFILSNPDDDNDSSTEPYSYYYEIERIV
jgi:hypothetical protein